MNMPTVTKNLIIINVLLFLGSFVAVNYGIDLDRYLGLHFFMADDFNLSQLFTYMFMHSGFQHLFFNMFAVWMFGRILEQVWGPKRFLFYYIFCGIGAGIIQEIIQFVQLYPIIFSSADVISTGSGLIDKTAFFNLFNTIGASGAVYAILLAFGMLFPNQSMFIFPLPFPIKAKYFVIGYAVLELYLGISDRMNDNVAHFAHLGGMVFGFILIMYWKKKNRNNGNIYY